MPKGGSNKQPSGQPIRLWDPLIRLVHWSLVVLLAALWWTWHSGRIPLHETLGYITLAVLLFRIFWGVIGSSTARFTHFVRGPKEIASYLRGGSPARIGHNPLGALSVLLLLGLMIADTGFGLFAEDVDGEESGALSRFVSYDIANWARGWHALLFNITIVVVAVHVLAILFYLLVKRDNLVGPMVTGRKRFDENVEQLVTPPAWVAALAILAAALIAWWASTGLKL